jgi:uncharacterized membrane protein YfcA
VDYNLKPQTSNIKQKTRMEIPFIFYILLFAVAFLYASVGHGGASGYLALMALFSIAPDVMKPTALMLNIFVSSTAFIQYYRAGHFHLKLFLPFAVASVPLSFVGGMMAISGNIYKQILGVLLFIPVIRFLGFGFKDVQEKKPFRLFLAMMIGGLIGLLSGMIGIGGGIILSPILLLLHWANQKEAAAVSAAFILVNSISGLIGQLTQHFEFSTNMYLFTAIAFAGGLAGSYFGSHRFNMVVLKRILGIVLLIASVKLLMV